MCLETIFNLKLHFSFSLGECITYICVLPWCFESFHLLLAPLLFIDFFNCEKKRRLHAIRIYHFPLLHPRVKCTVSESQWTFPYLVALPASSPWFKHMDSAFLSLNSLQKSQCLLTFLCLCSHSSYGTEWFAPQNHPVFGVDGKGSGMQIWGSSITTRPLRSPVAPPNARGMSSYSVCLCGHLCAERFKAFANSISFSFNALWWLSKGRHYR